MGERSSKTGFVCGSISIAFGLGQHLFFDSRSSAFTMRELEIENFHTVAYTPWENFRCARKYVL